jgi:hypothetical protein
MGTITVSKNGEDFFDIPDTEEQQAGAEAKGYKRYIDVTKNGTDIFTIPADDNLEKAFAKGYKTLDQHNATKDKSTATQITDTIGDTIKGISQGVTLGYGDEILGATGAVFGDGSYQENRDAKRKEYKEARERSPVANIAGEVGGSLVTGFAAPGIGTTLKGSVGMGAVQGLGNSEADLTEGDVLGAARDASLGAGAGALGYGTGKAIEKGIDVGPKFAKAIPRGWKAGVADAKEWTDGSLATLGGPVGAIKELWATGKINREIGDVARAARQVIKVRPLSELEPGLELMGVGNGKTLDALTDEEAITLALMQKGENPVKKWIVSRTGLDLNNFSKDTYLQALSEGTKDRAAARSLDTYQTAKQMVPMFDDAKKLFTETRNTRFSDLQNAARQEFDGVAEEVFSGIAGAKSDAASLKTIPGSVKNLLDDVEGLITQGKGTRAQKLTEGSWDEVAGPERFNRLQKARELVDSKINWAQAQGESQSESILKTLRGDIDSVLKKSEIKLEADDLFKASKDLENSFFRSAEFRNPDGTFDIDAAKIKRMLGDSDSAKRFRDNIELLEDFTNKPGLSREFKVQAKTLLTQLKNALQEADFQRKLGGIQRADGPSSVALQRMQAAMGGKGGVVKEAVTAPAGFMNNIDNFNQELAKRFGGTIDELTGPKKSAAVKIYLWLKRNPDASQADVERVWREYRKWTTLQPLD